MPYLLKVVAYILVIFGLGFISFWGFLPHGNPNISASAQGIAVFTGGVGRVETGLDLLEKHPATPMLITGVHPMVNLAQLLQGRKIDGGNLMYLTLDHSALTTKQNVKIVKKWAQKSGITKVALVTSNYHMPRSQILFWMYAPKLQVFPMPVEKYAPPSFLFREYVKLLLTPLNYIVK